MKKFSIILALDNENGIWKNNDLAWDIPDDRKYFRDITTKTKNTQKQNAVIMGRKTWESIPEKYRPFKNRRNFILSRSCKNDSVEKNWVHNFCSLDNCLSFIEKQSDIEEIFIIGWSQLYNQVLTHPSFEKAYITRVFSKFHCDVFFDGLPKGFDRISRSNMKEYKGTEYEFLIYKKKRNVFQKIKNFFN